LKRLAFIIIALLCSINITLAESQNNILRVAAARSAADSGLLHVLAMAYTQQNPNVNIEIASVGALQALDLGRNGNADLIITHHPPDEELFIEQGHGTLHSTIMYSRYAIFGPASLLQEFSDKKNIRETLKYIHDQEYDFLSPSPRSGTYRKIEELWALTGVAHHWLGYENTASSAAATLQQTGVTDALTLADLSLYYTNRNNIPAHIVPLYSGDTVLRNNFHAIVVRQDKHPAANDKLATEFLDFLISKQGQDLISHYSERNFGTDLFQPAAHLDPNIQARHAEVVLKEQRQNLYLLAVLAILLSGLLIFTILLGLKLRKANLRQIENERNNLQMQNDRDLALKSSQIKDEFISVVSHELRTPLTSIIAAQSLLENMYENKSSAERDLFDMATRNSERLLTVINDLLDMEKIHSESFNLHLKNMSLNQTIKESIRSNTPLASSYSVKLKFEESGSPCNVIADESRIIQVLTNLISNAIKHAPANSSVQISCKRMNDSIEVQVCDQGEGIPQEYTQSIFDRFTQIDSSSRRKTGGTGLGLAICKTIIEQHGGEIGVRPNQPTGSVFYFTLPVEK